MDGTGDADALQQGIQRGILAAQTGELRPECFDIGLQRGLVIAPGIDGENSMRSPFNAGSRDSCAIIASVVGQTSGQCVNPKNTRLGMPASWSVPNAWPR